MTDVFAFEGSLPTAKVISWGAAALRHDGRVWNPGTQRDCSEADAQRLIDEGHLSLLPVVVSIEARYLERPLVAAVVRLAAPHANFLVIDTGRVGGLITHGRAQGFQVYVFADQAAFDRYASAVIEDMLHRILFGEEDDDAARDEIARLGLTVHSGHPYLLATWVHLSGHDPFVDELARANLRGTAAHQTYEDVVTAFRSLDANYELIYEGGVSEGGGMDLNVAASTFSNLHYIHRQIGPTLERDYPFLHRAFGPPRFQEMKAASAHITFSAGPKDRPLGERLARVVELRAIQAALEGRAPEEIRANPRFEQAVKAVISPSPETVVTHRPIDSETPVPVEALDIGPVEVTRSEPMVVLGFQEDVKDRAHRIGIRIGPKAHIWVSATDNGEGERPEGVEVLHEGNDFLFRPAAFTIERRVEGGRRETFYLLRMTFLRDGDEAVLTALPSSVVDGAYLVDVEVHVKRISPDVLRIGGASDVHGLTGATLGMAAGWLRGFARGCRDREVAAARHDGARWIQPPRPPKPSALARVLVALQALGGEAPVPDVVDAVNRFFETNVRTNNTRREVLLHQELFEFVDEERKVIRLTDGGQEYLQAYLRAGGQTGLMAEG